MSIVRIGLAETKKFAAGYDAIFGKKKEAPAKKPKTAAGQEEKEQEEGITVRQNAAAAGPIGLAPSRCLRHFGAVGGSRRSRASTSAPQPSVMSSGRN